MSEDDDLCEDYPDDFFDDAVVVVPGPEIRAAVRQVWTTRLVLLLRGTLLLRQRRSDVRASVLRLGGQDLLDAYDVSQGLFRGCGPSFPEE